MSDPSSLSLSSLSSYLSTLYSSSSSSSDRRASESYLSSFQSSVASWSLCDAALHSGASGHTPLGGSSGPSVSLELLIFCAQTLRQKCSADFEELPPQASLQLRDSLFVLLAKYAAGPTAIRTALCVAIAAAATHLPSTAWESLGLIQWSVNKLASLTSTNLVDAIMNLLQVIPEEVGSTRVAVKPARRRAFEAEVRAAAPDAINAITNAAQSAASPDAAAAALRSYATWLHLAGSRCFAGGVAGLAAHPVCKATVDALAGDPDGVVFEGAIDTAVELLRCASVSQFLLTAEEGEVGAAPSMEQARSAAAAAAPIAQAVAARALELKPRLDKLIAEDPDDVESAKPIARIFAEVGEVFVEQIATATPEFAAPAEALLAVARHPDSGVAEMAAVFWFELQRKLLSSLEARGIDAIEADRRRAFFAPAFSQVLAATVVRLRYPKGDEERTWTETQRRELRQQRNYMTDLVRSCAALLGASETLKQLGTAVAATHEGRAGWEEGEAALAIACDAAHVLPLSGAFPGDAQIVGAFLAAVVAAPDALVVQRPHLLEQATMCCGSYAYWLADMLEREETGAADLLSHVLTLCAKGIALGGNAASSAAHGLMKTCMACAKFVSSEATLSNLLKLYASTIEAYLGAAAAAAAAANSTTASAAPPASNNQIDKWAMQDVTTALTSAVGALGDPKQREQGFLAVIDRPTAVLNSASASPPSTLISAQKQHAAQCLRAALSGMDAYPSIVAGALSWLWPTLEKAIESSLGDENTIEDLCKVVKYGIKASGYPHAAQLLPQLLATLPRAFARHPHGPILLVASELTKSLGGHVDKCAPEAWDVSLGEVVCSILSNSLSRFPSPQMVDENPHLADDTYLLGGRAVSYCARHVIARPDLIALMLDVGAISCVCKHVEAGMSACMMISKLCNSEDLRRSGAITQALAPPRGPRTLSRLLAVIAGAAPRRRVHDASDAIQAMYECLSIANMGAREWLVMALQAVPDTAASAADKSALADALQSGVYTTRSEVAIQEFSDCCRRTKTFQEQAVNALMALGG